MKTTLASVGGFTPVIDAVVQDVGPIGALVFGRVWRYCQGQYGACSAEIGTIAGELNISYRTALRHVKELCELGYLEDLTPDLRNRPHTYRETGKVMIVVQFGVQENACAMTESQSEKNANACAMTESQSTMTESQSTMTLSQSGSDLKSHEDTKKKEERKKKEIGQPEKPRQTPVEAPDDFVPAPDQIKEALRLQMTDQTFQAVIRPLHFERRNGACVITGPPTDETRRCLEFAEHRLARQIAQAAGVGELVFQERAG